MSRGGPENQTQVRKTKAVWSWLIQNRPAGLSADQGKLEEIWFHAVTSPSGKQHAVTMPKRQGQRPTSKTAVVGARCMRKDKALRALLAARGQGKSGRTLKAVPPVEVVASCPCPLSLAEVLLVVFGEQGVEERINATVAVGQTGGQIVNVTLGLGGEIQLRPKLT